MILDTETLLQKYEALVASGELAADDAQRRVAVRLDILHQTLGKLTARHNVVQRIAQCVAQCVAHFFSRPSSQHNRPQKMQGLYIHGDVGRGKSALMDLFFDTAPVAQKRRVHFHAFMQETHERIYAYRQKLKIKQVKGDDPIPPVADEIAATAQLLCFDEFQVKDIADASILGRLFTALFARGVVVVVTSNRAPENLYMGGLNRQRFLPFIALLQAQLEVLYLDAGVDYRLERLLERLCDQPRWFTPLGEQARAFMDERFATLVGGITPCPDRLEHKGRVLAVPCQAQGVARFGFADLCAANLGAGDYLALAQKYHTLMIDDIPQFTPVMRNEVLRFIALIDVLYEYKVKLVATAEAIPSALYTQTSTDGVNDGAFEFQRTVSRLMEVQSEDYLVLKHKAADNMDM